MSWLGWSLELRGNYNPATDAQAQAGLGCVGLGSVARVQSSPKSHMSHVQCDLGGRT